MVSGVIRERVGPMLSVLATVACGLWVRRGLGGDAGEHLGNLLWGVMWTLIVHCAAPRARLWVMGVCACAIVFGIEFFQLTPWPASWSEASVVARYLVGGRFEVHDLIGGAAGIALACAGLPVISLVRERAFGMGRS